VPKPFSVKTLSMGSLKMPSISFGITLSEASYLLLQKFKIEGRFLKDTGNIWYFEE